MRWTMRVLPLAALAPSPNPLPQAGEGFCSLSRLRERVGVRALSSRIFASLVCASRSTYASVRSEEHTSELQSLMRISYAVFCLKTKQNHPLYMTSQILYLNIHI